MIESPPRLAASHDSNGLIGSLGTTDPKKMHILHFFPAMAAMAAKAGGQQKQKER
jgi:hypothetical protein